MDELVILYLGSMAFLLIFGIIINWENLHTIGDFFTPLRDPEDKDDKSISVLIYLPGLNTIVSGFVIIVLIVSGLWVLTKKTKILVLFDKIFSKKIK